MNESYIKDKIEKGLSGSKVTVTGDGTHFEAIIISQEFDGKNTLQRHKMIYSILQEEMKEAIHALSMKTLTIDESNELK
jgi:acid stress-induced BolA-like protein IbaG/YrbA|tara:strand:- start:515 stop:751 length:237 start_codon:yes stop_codon:yes gene_type:complete